MINTYGEGYSAFNYGYSIDSAPYQYNTEEHDSWTEGWLDAQDDLNTKPQ